MGEELPPKKRGGPKLASLKKNNNENRTLPNPLDYIDFGYAPFAKDLVESKEATVHDILSLGLTFSDNFLNAGYHKPPGETVGLGEEELIYEPIPEAALEKLEDTTPGWGPARRQVEPGLGNSVSYVQGNENYNIWYGKYATDRFDPRHQLNERPPAATKCDPELDSGYTRADWDPHAGQGYICLYFARGCCSFGSDCTYYHRIPTVEDEARIDASCDVFGRDRHSKHREDMTGVGSFLSQGKSLFLGNVYPDCSLANPVEDLKATLIREFSRWGALEDITLVSSKGIAFIDFRLRVAAEFAKAAMSDQPIPGITTALSVKWAHEVKKEKKANVETRRQIRNNSVCQVDSSGYGYDTKTAEQLAADLAREIAFEEKQRQAMENLERLNSALAGVESLDVGAMERSYS